MFNITWHPTGYGTVALGKLKLFDIVLSHATSEEIAQAQRDIITSLLETANMVQEHSERAGQLLDAIKDNLDDLLPRTGEQADVEDIFSFLKRLETTHRNAICTCFDTDIPALSENVCPVHFAVSEQE